MSDWIHVADALPEMHLESTYENFDGSVTDFYESNPVLAFNGSYHVARTEMGGLLEISWTENDGAQFVDGVTHWMPLPNKPEEVNDETPKS